MRGVVVLTPDSATKDEIQSFVERKGGYWNPEPDLDEGVIARDSATVYVSISDTSDFEPQELAEVNERTGWEPTTSIWLQVGHGHGSSQLVREVLDELLESRRGFVIDDEDVLAELGA